MPPRDIGQPVATVVVGGRNRCADVLACRRVLGHASGARLGEMGTPGRYWSPPWPAASTGCTCVGRDRAAALLPEPSGSVYDAVASQVLVQVAIHRRVAGRRGAANVGKGAVRAVCFGPLPGNTGRAPVRVAKTGDQRSINRGLGQRKGYRPGFVHIGNGDGHRDAVVHNGVGSASRVFAVTG